MSERVSNQKEVVVSLILTVVLLVVLVLAHDFSIRPKGASRSGTYSQQLPDFSAIRDVKARKQAFFEYLRPIVRMENLKIRQQRELLLMLERKWQAGEHQMSWTRKLHRLAKSYGVDTNQPKQVIIMELKKRIDEIPEALVLVQAANESGWGQSRFAREANNLFGQWCFKKGCGLVPERRSGNAKHEVRRFDSPRASVASYMKNLNTHPAYAELRDIRASLRQNGRPVTALALLAGLHRYSERGEEYIAELRHMILYNRLERE